MATFGWVVFILGGAYLAGAAGFALSGLRGGGLEAIPLMIVCGVLSAAAWVVFAFWLSPFAFTMAQ